MLLLTEMFLFWPKLIKFLVTQDLSYSIQSCHKLLANCQPVCPGFDSPFRIPLQCAFGFVSLAFFSSLIPRGLPLSSETKVSTIQIDRDSVSN